jgi:parvulin-like peptidyl-prolyl isomerase
MTETQNQPSAPGESWFSRHRRLSIGGAVFVVIAVVFGVGVYRYGWDGRVTRLVTALLPYPAAIIEGQVIRYADFQEDLGILEDFYETERKKSPETDFPDDQELRGRVMERLLKDQMARILAARYGIEVTSEDVRKTYESTILDQSDGASHVRSEAKAEATLQDLYGIDVSQFKDRVLMPFLLRQKLEEKIRQDDELNAEKIKKAEAAAAALKTGKPFNEVAIAFSEDANIVSTAGHRGFVGRGMLPVEVETAAFAMARGETSGVIRSPLGFHVIMISDTMAVKGETTKIDLHEILIRPVSLDDYLEAQLKTASVIRFIQ